MDKNEYKYSSDFLKALMEKARTLSQNGNTIDTILKDDYGVENIFDYELPDLKDKDQTDFIFTNVRGSVPLMKGKIITVKEAEEISVRVSKINFKKILALAHNNPDRYQPKLK
jgi:hypothetical protein